MRKAPLLAAAALICAGCGNISFLSRPTVQPDFLGVANAYVSDDALPEFDGVVDITVMNPDSRPGELVRVELWPLAGVALGAFGFRFRLFMFELAFGTLWYPVTPEGATDLGMDSGGDE